MNLTFFYVYNRFIPLTRIVIGLVGVFGTEIMV